MLPASISWIYEFSVRANIRYRVFQSVSEIMMNYPHLIQMESAVKQWLTKMTELSEYFWARRSTTGDLQAEYGLWFAYEEIESVL